MERGSSSSSSYSRAGGADSLVNGLNFGKKIYFKGVGSGLQAEIGGGLTPALPYSARRGRAGAVQPPLCQVEGCNADLSDDKAYYSRHKVCSVHSKFPKVVVAGIEQRFCQQCSRYSFMLDLGYPFKTLQKMYIMQQRFHQLPEFDQGKRSCRRRLAGHNERRRKPPPRSLLPPRCGSLPSAIFAGEFLMNFSTYPMLNGSDKCPCIIPEPGLGNQAIITGKHQPLWKSNSHNSLPDLPQGSTTSPTCSVGSLAPPEECFSRVPDSSSALSLLSSHQWGSRNQSLSPDMNIFCVPNRTAIVQSSLTPCASFDQIFSPSWDFKSHQANGMNPDAGFVQLLHPCNGQYNGELGLSQPTEDQFHELKHSRGYDSSVHHMHWSL